MIAHSELQRILFLILAEGTWLHVSGRLVAGYTRTVILLYKEFTGTLIGIEQSAAFAEQTMMEAGALFNTDANVSDDLS